MNALFWGERIGFLAGTVCGVFILHDLLSRSEAPRSSEICREPWEKRGSRYYSGLKGATLATQEAHPLRQDPRRLVLNLSQRGISALPGKVRWTQSSLFATPQGGTGGCRDGKGVLRYAALRRKVLEGHVSCSSAAFWCGAPSRPLSSCLVDCSTSSVCCTQLPAKLLPRPQSAVFHQPRP